MYHVHLCHVWIRLPTLVSKVRGDVTRSPKQGYQWSHKRKYVHEKFKRKDRLYLDTIGLVADTVLIICLTHAVTVDLQSVFDASPSNRYRGYAVNCCLVALILEQHKKCSTLFAVGKRFLKRYRYFTQIQIWTPATSKSPVSSIKYQDENNNK